MAHVGWGGELPELRNHTAYLDFRMLREMTHHVPYYICVRATLPKGSNFGYPTLAIVACSGSVYFLDFDPKFLEKLFHPFFLHVTLDWQA